MKTTATLHGSSGSLESTKSGWTRDSGYYETKTYNGTEAYVNSIAAAARAANIEYDITSGPLWQIITQNTNITDNSGQPSEVPQTTFEIVDVSSVKDSILSQNPLTNLLSATTKIYISGVTAQSKFFDVTQVPVAERPAAAYLYELYMAGAREYYVAAMALRKSYTVTNNYTISENMVNVNRIHTKWGLINMEQVPYRLQGALPNSYTETRGNIVFIAGYHKSMPSSQTIQQYATSQISVNYTFGVWPVELYGNYYC
jgi:hypothetical protein